MNQPVRFKSVPQVTNSSCRVAFGVMFACFALVPAAEAAAKPKPPSNLLAAAVSSSQINLSWADNSNNETGFKVQRSINRTNFSAIATLGANVTNYSDVGRAASTKYYYRVQAYNNTGNSNFSNVASATTNPAPT